ncbi:hypothetical protein GCL60_10385 [Silvanigrella paludirubra]|uniref:Lipoprotein n=1 Tax=Silvanigrella paludirubra TaxID=2499159 RepID=A0A6N6VUR8_9BACT|nr:hypothetical protein [Silvanigrella paludirubra]KAB8037575.1 hypothetical protein GCL60_10385 [Silvanigrella paludirubra]
MLKKFVKILSSLLIILILSLSLSGCKNQQRSPNLNSDIVFTKFSFNARKLGNINSAIESWEVNSQLHCSGLIFSDGNTYLIDQKFTKSGNETIDFPIGPRYNCELSIKSFNINKIDYFPQNKNSLFKIKRNNSNKIFRKYVNQKNYNDHKFITGKMNPDIFSLYIFEKANDTALFTSIYTAVFNDIEISFTSLDDPQYARIQIKNNSRSENSIKINEINLIALSDLSLQQRSKNNNDINYEGNYQCVDNDAEDNYIISRIKTLNSGSRCALVFKANNSTSTSRISIRIDNILYNLNINFKDNIWTAEINQ